jgi:regulator of nonsense transcripts 3
MAPSKSKPSQPSQRLKAVVRRLPPDLPPAVFWKTVEPWVQRHSPTEEGQATAENKENELVAWSEFKQGIVRKP